jgi:hypothetical protein
LKTTGSKFLNWPVFNPASLCCIAALILLSSFKTIKRNTQKLSQYPPLYHHQPELAADSLQPPSILLPAKQPALPYQPVQVNNLIAIKTDSVIALYTCTEDNHNFVQVQELFKGNTPKVKFWHDAINRLIGFYNADGATAVMIRDEQDNIILEKNAIDRLQPISVTGFRQGVYTVILTMNSKNRLQFFFSCK